MTVFGRWLSERLGVSIHTPTQGVTLRGMALQTILNRFNPHTHAGCDDDVLKTAIVTKVSIHTPTQGVTNLISIFTTKFEFQSTHPRRV